MNHEQRVQSIFEEISPSYNLANDFLSFFLHRYWKNTLIKKVKNYVGQTTPAQKRVFLDVCCGTGDIALKLAKLYPQYKVYGLDFSVAMLQVTHQKRRLKHLHNLYLTKASALALPFKPQTIDVSTISFGLRNTSSYTKALEEIYRVLKPGGLILCLDSFLPTSKFILPFYKLYFQHLMPLVTGYLSGHTQAYRWLDTSTRNFLTSESLRALFCEVGFTNISYRSFLFGCCNLHIGYKPNTSKEVTL